MPRFSGRRRKGNKSPQTSALLQLPNDMLALTLYQLPLAHDIAASALTCHSLHAAAKEAQKLRPFTGKVVTLKAAECALGHKSEINAVAAAPEGVLVTGADKGLVRVWKKEEVVCTIEAHDAHVIAVAVLPGGQRFVSVSTDCTVKLWSLNKILANEDNVLERTFNMGSVVLSAAAVDAERFVVGGWQEASLYHIDGTHLKTFEGHTSSVNALAVTLDGQHVVSGGYDTLVKVWEVASGDLVSTCEGPAGLVRAVAAMPDGKRILSGSDGGAVRVWLLDGTHQNTFEGLHAQTVLALVALPDNVHALSGGNDIKLFNVDDGSVLRTFKHHTNTVSSLTLLSDGLRFASASYDCTARIVEHGLAPL
jgi:WD40 repeat protein